MKLSNLVKNAWKLVDSYPNRMTVNMKRTNMKDTVEKQSQFYYPFIHSNMIDKSIEYPCVVNIKDPDGEFIGSGFYNPIATDIQIRKLSTNTHQIIDERFVSSRLEESIQRRFKSLDLPDILSGVCLVNGESDDLPGLNIDMYFKPNQNIVNLTDVLKSNRFPILFVITCTTQCGFFLGQMATEIIAKSSSVWPERGFPIPLITDSHILWQNIQSVSTKNKSAFFNNHEFSINYPSPLPSAQCLASIAAPNALEALGKGDQVLSRVFDSTTSAVYDFDARNEVHVGTNPLRKAAIKYVKALWLQLTSPIQRGKMVKVPCATFSLFNSGVLSLVGGDAQVMYNDAKQVFNLEQRLHKFVKNNTSLGANSDFLSISKKEYTPLPINSSATFPEVLFAWVDRIDHVRPAAEAIIASINKCSQTKSESDNGKAVFDLKEGEPNGFLMVEFRDTRTLGVHSAAKRWGSIQSALKGLDAHIVVMEEVYSACDRGWPLVSHAASDTVALVIKISPSL